MDKQRDGREAAQRNEARTLKYLYRFGFLRTRDIAALVWRTSKTHAGKGQFAATPITVSPSSLRMGQRTLARLLAARLVIRHTAPDGANLYGLSEGGARFLREQGIPAQSSRHWLRRFSPNQYHHRRLSTELAIMAIQQGFRVVTEREIAMGQWFGGQTGIAGKKPDAIIRSGPSVWWVEVERSRKNGADYTKLLAWLGVMWQGQDAYAAPPLTGGFSLQQVVFLAAPAFTQRLAEDLARRGWEINSIEQRIMSIPLLYGVEAKFIELSRQEAAAAGTA